MPSLLLLFALLLVLADAYSVPPDARPFEIRCPSRGVGPQKRPNSVLDLHPGHFGIVSAIGDSISAGFGARRFYPLEFRGSSFSGGKGYERASFADEKTRLQNSNAKTRFQEAVRKEKKTFESQSQHTLPYLVRWYAQNLTGFSTEDHRVPTWQAWENPYLLAQGDNLNVAVSGAESNYYQIELNRFEEEIEKYS